jgi:hypothetical protein
MAATLNRRAYEHAINNGRFVFDECDVWSEHRPSAQKKTTSGRPIIPPFLAVARRPAHQLEQLPGKEDGRNTRLRMLLRPHCCQSCPRPVGILVDRTLPLLAN